MLRDDAGLSCENPFPSGLLLSSEEDDDDDSESPAWSWADTESEPPRASSLLPSGRVASSGPHWTGLFPGSLFMVILLLPRLACGALSLQASCSS